MGKTILYHIFGLGKIPKKFLPDITREGIILMDEGIGGSVTFRKFRAPGKRYGYRRNWFSGSVVLTQKTFLAFTTFNPVIGVPWDDQRLNALEYFLEKTETLCVRYDASVFNEEWSGTIECRFKTPKARIILETIERKKRCCITPGAREPPESPFDDDKWRSKGHKRMPEILKGATGQQV